MKAVDNSQQPITVRDKTDNTVAATNSSTNIIIETVCGGLDENAVVKASAHEHLFADFHSPSDAGFMQVDWRAITQTCITSVQELRRQDVNLFIDWTTKSLGRNALMMRDISIQTGMNIVAATGFYKQLIPNGYENLTVDELAEHFYAELADGIDGTPMRAGFIKIATTEAGPTKEEVRIHRAAALAANKAGAAIALHSPYEIATETVVNTLCQENFDLTRLVWGHAQCSPAAAQLKQAERGVVLAFDGISTDNDAFFHGPTDDESMLERIEMLANAGFSNQILVSTDAAVCVNPPELHYDRHNHYLHGVFSMKLRARLGSEMESLILRDNVLSAFRRGERLNASKIDRQ
ncbi:hypothetical protein JMY81_12345 [Brenneria goodwinii]|uniref:phosphotriesterase family protein n=1 Tax=Brenneria goodwinii TaxID=1109412 RepID=UPI00160359B0|nr:hypothetical protein [Brenneria goodwinii]MCG8155417.1 hypothetical protein [Brenneria goodwinii]MCG8161617.1 hypothetical protein [Brenneria goodwinii]MCG8166036.1 hypothetical protein [Brenneria goodwinii]MCG8169264.1 hypothetical protein [Brenneria goodwinii]MCG8175732.1 hypothetical protein [Brenneria goodwinii]